MIARILSYRPYQILFLPLSYKFGNGIMVSEGVRNYQFFLISPQNHFFLFSYILNSECYPSYSLIAWSEITNPYFPSIFFSKIIYFGYDHEIP